MLQLISNSDIGGFSETGSFNQAIFSSFDFLHMIAESNVIFAVKIISVIISLVFIGIIIHSLYKIQQILYPPFVPADVPAGGVPAKTSPTKRMYDEEFAQVKKYVDSDLSTEWKIAVLEGDKILDDALRNAGIFGETMGERLKSMTRTQFPMLDDVWEAHKLRNLIAHDINVSVSQEQARAAVDIFGKALYQLQVLS